MLSSSGDRMTLSATRGTLPSPTRFRDPAELSTRREQEIFLLLCDILAGERDAKKQARVGKIVSQPEVLAALVNLAEQERVLPALHEIVTRPSATLLPKAYRAVIATQFE